jgi:alkylated DNA repair dioxygenase AlkB
MLQEDLFAGRDRQWQNILNEDGICDLLPLAVADHWQHLQLLKKSINWRQDSIFLFGKNHSLPRLQAWYGDEECLYRYSGLTLRPSPWSTEVLWLKREVERLCKNQFNCVLISYYRHELDHMGWHSDDEAELGPDPVIASLSLGQERRFELRHRILKTRDKVAVGLGSGDLLLMHGPLQRNWQHRLVSTTTRKDERINLTFRKILIPTPIHSAKTLKI